MCKICDMKMGRRGFLGSLGRSGGGAISPMSAFAAGGPTTDLTADQALAKLKEGNNKYITAPQVCAIDLANARSHTATSQTPGRRSSDAPTAALRRNAVRGIGVGELFVARNAVTWWIRRQWGRSNMARRCSARPDRRPGSRAVRCRRGSVRSCGKEHQVPGSIGPMVSAIVPAARAVKGKPETSSTIRFAKCDADGKAGRHEEQNHCGPDQSRKGQSRSCAIRSG